MLLDKNYRNSDFTIFAQDRRRSIGTKVRFCSNFKGFVYVFFLFVEKLVIFGITVIRQTFG